MKFALSDLRRARFPDPIVKGRKLCFPEFEGRVSDCDGRFFRIKRKLGIDLKHWIMFDGQIVPVDQVHVVFGPGDAQPISDRAVERFQVSGDLTLEGLKLALLGPDEEAPPSMLSPPVGNQECVAYFKKHEPYVHVLLARQPDLFWRCYFRGAIPTGLEGFEQDYNSSVLGKMVSYHEPVPLVDSKKFISFLESQIKPPALPFLWMADYARRKGFADAQGLSDGETVSAGLLTLPVAQGLIEPRYSREVMSLLMANPHRQLTALVLFALTDGKSGAWPKPPGFDQWLFSTFAAP
jgi:hypothetical protein